MYFFKYKSKVFEKFKKWKILTEHQIGKTLKKLRTDNNLEYCNHEFTNFCKQNGIVRHRTCSETLLTKLNCWKNEQNYIRREKMDEVDLFSNDAALLR